MLLLGTTETTSSRLRRRPISSYHSIPGAEAVLFLGSSPRQKPCHTDSSVAMTTGQQLAVLNREIVACRKCPRLVRHRETVARNKRRAYRDWIYWGL